MDVPRSHSLTPASSKPVRATYSAGKLKLQGPPSGRKGTALLTRPSPLWQDFARRTTSEASHKTRFYAALLE